MAHLSTSEVAAMTDPPVTRFTVEREIRRGNLAGEKVAGRWVIDEGAAKEWAAAFEKHAGNRRPQE